MTSVHRTLGIAGAATATGPTAVIDTFRAFTTAAVLFDRGIDRLFLADSVDEAADLAVRHRALLCGEVGGVKPDGFDMGNSPSEAGRRPDLAGATVVQRTSSGTRSVLAALRNGADPVLAASAVVASATAAYLAGSAAVTLACAGQNGVDPAEEDELTADIIQASLERRGVPTDIGQRIAQCDRAIELASSSWASPDDVTIAADVDRYAFVMVASPLGSEVELRLKPRPGTALELPGSD